MVESIQNIGVVGLVFLSAPFRKYQDDSYNQSGRYVFHEHLI